MKLIRFKHGRITELLTNYFNHATPGLCYKIPVFSDPAPGKSYATTYEQMGS